MTWRWEAATVQRTIINWAVDASGGGGLTRYALLAWLTCRLSDSYRRNDDLETRCCLTRVGVCVDIQIRRPTNGALGL